MKKILIITDAWDPQTNGVVTWVKAMEKQLPRFGIEVELLTPEGFTMVKLYPDVEVAAVRPGLVEKRIEGSHADHVHITTEGPLGICARIACRRAGRPVTTSYHTNFPEYLARHHLAPTAVTYALLRLFHNGSIGTVVATETLRNHLQEHGFKNLLICRLGVDTNRFSLIQPAITRHQRPLWMACGRVAKEKNLEAFLDLDLPGTKMVVGEGAATKSLQAKYPDAIFTGPLHDQELVEAYACADVLVFPSVTDTFGLVMLEAMACGTPVAAFPVAGPLDVVGTGGVLDKDLRRACVSALDVPRWKARNQALNFSWEESAKEFVENLETVLWAHHRLQEPSRLLLA